MTKRSHKTNRSIMVPHVGDEDDYVEAMDFDYPNYCDEDTYVVSGSLGRDDKPWIKGRNFYDIKTAEKWVLHTFGSYIERIRGGEPDRWAFRVVQGSHRSIRLGIADDMASADPERKTKFRVL